MQRITRFTSEVIAAQREAAQGVLAARLVSPITAQVVVKVASSNLLKALEEVERLQGENEELKMRLLAVGEGDRIEAQ